MAEPTNPVTGVTQEPPSVEQRMQAFLTQYDEEQASPPPEPEQPSQPEVEATPAESQAQTDELTPDDIPDQEPQAQPTADEFEIVHNGQQRKLTREETIRYAQQGFDYTQKTQALAESQKQVQQVLQRAQQMEQLQNALAPDLAQVKAVEAQLQQYQNVDWVRVATDNPLEYPKYRAQYDQMVAAYQAAVGRFQHKAGALQQERQAVTAQIAQQQRTALLDMLPAWRDPAKYEAGAAEVRDYLIREGVDPAQVEQLNDAKSVLIAYKAAQYDKLARSKADKVKQLKTAPPVTRPNASQGKAQVNAEQRQKMTDRLRRTGDVKDAAALLLDRWK